MKKLIAILFFLFLFIPFIFTQEAAEETYKEMFLDGEFFLAEEEYIDALTFYERLYKRGYEDNANINYRMGICYVNITGQKDKAIQYLEKAITKTDDSYKEGVFRQDKAPFDAYIYLGNAYRVNNQLDDAINAYEKYKTLIDEKKDVERKYADQQIKACKIAQEMQKEPVKVELINVGNKINTGSSNYNPVVSRDGNFMAFMHELPFYDAVYYSMKENGIWDKPRNITPEIQSDGDLFVHSFSNNGKTLLLTREDAFNSDIWISILQENGKWSIAQPLNKTINTKYWESHASLSPDGKTLYFSSNRKEGYGQMDIYTSELTSDNIWSEPKNLGSTINTELNEDCPTISPDGKKLYFSSQGHRCMGGYDIFISEKNPDGTWKEPVNIGYPLNTTDDELFYYPTNDKNQGYMAMMREDSYGKEDIYHVKISALEKEVTTIALADTIQPKIEEEISKEIKEEVTEDIEEKVEEVEEEISEPELIKPEIKTIKISPVLFDFNSVSLTSEAIKILDKVINILNENSNANIELNGYCDVIGSEEINIIVSQQRARSVRNYLMKNGIATNRMKIYGYGRTAFVAINNNPNGTDNPEGRKYNRRVEIIFSNLDENVQIVEIDNVPDHLKLKK